MIVVSDDKKNDFQWRNKYRAVLEKKVEIEEKLEKDSEAYRRSLSRLSLAMDGVAPEVDPLVKQLKKLSSEDNTSAGQLLGLTEKIADMMVEADLNRTASQEEQYELCSKLLDEISYLEISAPLKGEVKKKQKYLKKHKFDPDIAQKILYVAESTVNELLSQHEPGGGVKPSLINRLLGKQSETDSEESTALAPVDNEHLPVPVVNEFRQFLDLLSTNEEYSERVSSLLQELEDITDVDELNDFLRDLGGLVIDLSEAGHAQFETFLQQINERLSSLQAFLDDSVDPDKSGVEDQLLLDKQLREQVAGLRSAADESDSIEKLKVSVEGRLDNILGSLDSFKAKSAERQEAADRMIVRLKMQLNEAQKQSKELERTIAHQRDQAVTDSLTRIPNRYGFQAQAQQEVARWKRYGTPLCLIMLDVDHFKKINDSYGHLAGDHVLRDVAGVLTDTVRQTDCVSRFGGEEFVVIVPQTILVDAAKTANKLRLAIQNHSFSHQEHEISVTISAGAADFCEGDELDDVLERADSALYRAKQMGRNKVCLERAAVKKSRE